MTEDHIITRYLERGETFTNKNGVTFHYSKPLNSFDFVSMESATDSAIGILRDWGYSSEAIRGLGLEICKAVLLYTNYLSLANPVGPERFLKTLLSQEIRKKKPRKQVPTIIYQTDYTDLVGDMGLSGPPMTEFKPSHIMIALLEAEGMTNAAQTLGVSLRTAFRYKRKLKMEIKEWQNQ